MKITRYIYYTFIRNFHAAAVNDIKIERGVACAHIPKYHQGKMRLINIKRGNDVMCVW